MSTEVIKSSEDDIKSFKEELLNIKMDNEKKYKQMQTVVEDLISKKIGDDMYSLSFKVSSMQKEITNIYAKYDKIFLENLELPGVIGKFGQFANLKEYIDVCIILLIIHKE